MSAFKVAMIASLFVSSAAFAQDAAQAPAVPAPVKEKMICRSEVPVGSIRPKRTCMTKSQWTALHKQNGDAAETAIDSVRSRANAGLNSAAQ